ncbi:MAG: hypothetical protein IJ601_04320 [Acidaminococcaceae bacterium]|nr:hypothetical protein [Acidaminococcaceae bacterium]
MGSTDNRQSNLEQIPNSVSGDGKTFVAQLKKYLQSFRNSTQEKIDGIGAGAVEQVFRLRLTEEHDYDSKGNPINNIFVEFDNTNVSNYLNAQVWMRKSTETAFHMVGTTSNVTYTITDVKAGATYYVKVVACSTNSGTSDFDTAPTEDIEIRGSVLVPAAPTQFYLTWDENGPLWEWQFIDNGYVDFFELRMDGLAGTWNANRLDSTRETFSRAEPPVRSGTAYLFIRNIYGTYSQPATHTFNIAAPAKPTAPTLEMTLDGVVITMDPLPLGCTGYEIEITDWENNTEIFESKNNQFVYFQFMGNISVRYRFVDIVGHGEWSDAVSGNMKTVLNAIELPEISYAMFDAATKASVDRAGTALTQVDLVRTQLTEIITAQGEGTSSQFALLQSQVNQDTNDISTIIATLNVDPSSSTSYTAINLLQQRADTLSSTISSDRATQAAVNQNVSTSISNLTQTANGLSSTVQSLQTTTNNLNSRITTNASNITQASNSITAVVTELSKSDPSKVNYASIAALSNGIDLCVKDVDLTGREIVNRINIQPQVTTIDGKFLHVTGQTVFEQSVIVGSAIASGAVTAAKIGAGAVTDAKIGSGAVTEAKIASSAVTAVKIGDGAVIAAKIASNAVTAAKIAANAVTTDKLNASAVTAAKIAANAITADKIAADAVTAEKILAGSIISDKIAANAVTSTKIAASAVTATQIAANAVTADKIKAGAVTAGKIAANAVTADKIAAGAVTSSEIAAGAVTAEKIAASSVIAAKIASNAVTAAKIAANAVTSAKIAANAITADKIAAGAITADKLAAGVITADKIFAAGYEVRASVLKTDNISTPSNSTASNGAQIPIPSGYTESQCIWGITRVSGQPNLQLTGRRVWYDYNTAGSGYATKNSYTARYWILGIK